MTLEYRPPRRVLITGMSNPLGAEVARRLAPQVPYLFGCDVADPVSALEDMDFVHADTRHAVIGKLIRQLQIDTVVHMAVSVDSARDDRAAHETNVIGTMNVLVGCTGPSSPVERLVVKSSQAIYGAAASDPSFFSEEMVGADRQGGSFVTRDLREMEQLVGEFADRSSACRVTVLRLGYRVAEDTKLAKYLLLPIVPTFAGFDPRLQLLHEEDAAEAVVRAGMGEHAGTFNVAGAGVVLVSQAIAIMRGKAAPLLFPYGRWMARYALRAATGVVLPGHLADLLTYGSVADCSRLTAEFGWSPAYSTRAVMDAFARGKDAEVIEAPSPRQEYELQVYLQRRRRAERKSLRDGGAEAGPEGRPRDLEIQGSLPRLRRWDPSGRGGPARGANLKGSPRRGRKSSDDGTGPLTPGSGRMGSKDPGGISGPTSRVRR